MNFTPSEGADVIGRLDGGRITSDGGGLLLREVDNSIKEQQLGLFADRTSTATMRANQLRLYFSSFAYVLMHGLRRLGLAGTAHAKAQSSTIRVRLLKIGARIRVTVRKVWLSFSEAYPYADDIARILGNLQRHPIWVPPGKSHTGIACPIREYQRRRLRWHHVCTPSKHR